MSYKQDILAYEKKLQSVEKFHFQSAYMKALFFIKKFPEYFIDKSILDYGCYMGYTSFVFSLYAQSVDAYDANPNCEFVFNYNNIEGNKLRWQPFEKLKYNYYDTIFMYSVAQLNKFPKEWLEELVNQLNFTNLIIGDSEKSENWYTKKSKLDSILSGSSPNYDYSIGGFCREHIDNYVPAVSNLQIIKRYDNLIFPGQGFTNIDPYRNLKNELKKIVYVCKKS